MDELRMAGAGITYLALLGLTFFPMSMGVVIAAVVLLILGIVLLPRD